MLKVGFPPLPAFPPSFKDGFFDGPPIFNPSFLPSGELAAEPSPSGFIAGTDAEGGGVGRGSGSPPKDGGGAGGSGALGRSPETGGKPGGGSGASSTSLASSGSSESNAGTGGAGGEDVGMSDPSSSPAKESSTGGRDGGKEGGASSWEDSSKEAGGRRVSALLSHSSVLSGLESTGEGTSSASS